MYGMQRLAAKCDFVLSAGCLSALTKCSFKNSNMGKNMWPRRRFRGIFKEIRHRISSSVC